MQDILNKAKAIKLLVLDVDGVLSDGRLYFSNSGDEIKAFSTLDGQGIKRDSIAYSSITGYREICSPQLWCQGHH